MVSKVKLISIGQQLVGKSTHHLSFMWLYFPCRMWFRRPTTNIQILKERQKAVAFFQSPQNVETTASIQDCLKQIKCISVSMHNYSAQQRGAD